MYVKYNSSYVELYCAIIRTKKIGKSSLKFYYPPNLVPMKSGFTIESYVSRKKIANLLSRRLNLHAIYTMSRFAIYVHVYCYLPATQLFHLKLN